MNLDELAVRFGKMAADARNKLGDEMDIVATTVVQMVVTRDTEEGIDSTGKPFEEYSDTKLPLFFFTNREELPLPGQVYDGPKVKGKRRKKVDLGLKYPDGIAYLEYKTEIGRFRGIVDFTLTGDMWDRFGIIERGFVGNGYIVRVGGRDEETKNKLRWNNATRPGFTKPSKQEKETVRDQSQARMGAWARAYISGNA